MNSNVDYRVAVGQALTEMSKEMAMACIDNNYFVGSLFIYDPKEVPINGVYRKGETIVVIDLMVEQFLSPLEDAIKYAKVVYYSTEHVFAQYYRNKPMRIH